MSLTKIDWIDEIFLRIMGGLIIAVLALAEIALLKYIFN